MPERSCEGVGGGAMKRWRSEEKKKTKKNDFRIIVVWLCGVAWERYYGLIV